MRRWRWKQPLVLGSPKPIEHLYCKVKLALGVEVEHVVLTLMMHC